MMRRLLAVRVVLLVVVGLFACSDEEVMRLPPPLASGGSVVVDIVLPTGAESVLVLAADDLADVFATRSGATRRAPTTGEAQGRAAVQVVLLEPPDPALGDEGHRLVPRDGARPTLEVQANTALGAAYGLWELAWASGARYLHPEDTFVPRDPANAFLPWPEESRVNTPHFARRGFHEHTQHPIVASDTFLRADFPGGRASVSRQLRWLARNRQNLLTVQLLGTVDMDTWPPYMAGIAAEAHTLGITVGVVLGFTDQQQHAFRLVREGTVDGDGQAIPAEVQIREGLDRVLAAGLDHVVFQIGTSEFTAPDPAVTLAYLDAAVSHIVGRHPSVTPHAWIHITCGLETDDGEPFFHTPLQADPALGAWVHTTMFYTLKDPAPVYDCEDFTHQLDFLEAAAGQRAQTFFPESAWWLGFDNNLPLLLPITGVSREADIATVKAYGVTGHVTFTTGREWLYWLYDLYVSRAAWDSQLTWQAFLADMAFVWGDAGGEAARVLVDWTELQRRELYEENPEIYFYLAGELPQDEAGAAAGVLARRPKLAFKAVRDYDDATFAAWKTRDLDMLARMRTDYAALMSRLPEAPAKRADEAVSTRLYRELFRSAWVHLKRIDHAFTLYDGVAHVRAGDRAGAAERLAAAKQITAEVSAALTEAEDDYREPVAWLARPKPDSLTVYPFGYLYETSTAYFWKRRDDQLQNLITNTFDGEVERWPAEPLLVFAAERADTRLTHPEDPVASSVLGGFVPRLLLGVLEVDAEAGLASFALAPDRNGNDQPEGEPLALTAAVVDGGFTANAATWVLPIYDDADQKLGDLVLRDVIVTGTLTVEGTTVSAVPAMALSGEVASTDLIALVQSVAGIDTEGLRTLLAAIWGIPSGTPLPDRLPIALAFEPRPSS